MDNPNLPENEPEEITWQDDENCATLFLRSVFVLLSGALILGTSFHWIFPSTRIGVVYVLVMYVILPVCIIWFFFGQGLRPVEWLTDQKYNAWNYGMNFGEWKSHLKPAAVLSIIGIGVAFLGPLFLWSPGTARMPSDLISTTLITWFGGVCLCWFLWGYLWFGLAQGFGDWAAAFLIPIITGGTIVMTTNGNALHEPIFIGFLLILLWCGYLCHKYRSFAPILYVVLVVGFALQFSRFFYIPQ
jgi:hypothetical protein